jgi:hypothetical protein
MIVFLDRSTHILLVALAVSDICFSVAIHPMLAVVSFGVPAHDLFGDAGESLNIN